MIPIFVAIGVALTVVILILGLGGLRRDRTSGRLDAQAPGLSVPKPVTDIRRNESDSAIPGFDRLVKRFMPRREALRARLMRTGRNITIGHYILASALIALLMALVIIKFFQFPNAVGVLVGVTAGLGIPHMVIGRMGTKRVAAFNAQFPEAIDLMVRGLRSGMPIQDSIGTISREIPDPVGGEFQRVDTAVRFGQTFESALWMAAKRIVVPEFQFFIVSISVQRETGGNLAETLANLSDLLRKRRQMKLKIKAMSSEARASAWVLGSLPFVLFGILMVIAPGYVLTLFRDPRGLVMVGIALASITTGILIMVKMVRFEI